MSDQQHDEWFEVSEDMWRDPHEKRSTLRLLADHNISATVVEKMQNANINIRSAKEMGCERLEDSTVISFAKSNELVLLTTDSDFWSERKFPLVAHSGSAIVIESPPGDTQRVLSSIGFFYGTFGKSFGGRWANGLRIKAYPDRFLLKAIGASGEPVRYEMKLRENRLVAREITTKDRTHI